MNSPVVHGSVGVHAISLETGRGHLFRTCGIPATRPAIDLEPNQGLNDYVFDQSCRCRSTVTRSFLRELHAGGESEFGVDVGEVSLHGAR
ncbi:MAG: hypothetical protein JWR13_5178 [Mycobacterium sp.]|nr:hypothetical protein [Mycobacterium sp.]